MQLDRTKFIGVFENAFSHDFCDRVVSFMDRSISCGATGTRQQIEKVSRLKKDDQAVFSCDIIDDYKTDTLWPSWAGLTNTITNEFWQSIYPAYADVYGALQDATEAFQIEGMKVQRVEVGGGYHMWHYESSSRVVSQRNLAWTLYLNDVHEGGETEFLYQSVRVQPKRGTFVLWPAGFTHTHRGNPPLSNSKYIVTGWTALTA
jgi:hypothetical protein